MCPLSQRGIKSEVKINMYVCRIYLFGIQLRKYTTENTTKTTDGRRDIDSEAS